MKLLLEAYLYVLISSHEDEGISEHVNKNHANYNIIVIGDQLKKRQEFVRNFDEREMKGVLYFKNF